MALQLYNERDNVSFEWSSIDNENAVITDLNSNISIEIAPHDHWKKESQRPVSVTSGSIDYGNGFRWGAEDSVSLIWLQPYYNGQYTYQQAHYPIEDPSNYSRGGLAFRLDPYYPGAENFFQHDLNKNGKIDDQSFYYIDAISKDEANQDINLSVKRNGSLSLEHSINIDAVYSSENQEAEFVTVSTLEFTKDTYANELTLNSNDFPDSEYLSAGAHLEGTLSIENNPGSVARLDNKIWEIETSEYRTIFKIDDIKINEGERKEIYATREGKINEEQALSIYLRPIGAEPGQDYIPHQCSV